jgi:hypothetical protein
MDEQAVVFMQQYLKGVKVYKAKRQYGCKYQLNGFGVYADRVLYKVPRFPEKNSRWGFGTRPKRRQVTDEHEATLNDRT